MRFGEDSETQIARQFSVGSCVGELTQTFSTE